MLTIVDYIPKNSSHRYEFERLNREWLEKYFAVEDVDIKYFASPENEILAKGGEIFFAQQSGKIVGTCSLLWEEGKLELAKMGVEEAHQGQGVGNLLLIEGIRRARARGEKTLTLVTNSGLTPAVRLYKKYGFVETSREQNPKYRRGDLAMQLDLISAYVKPKN